MCLNLRCGNGGRNHGRGHTREELACQLLVEIVLGTKVGNERSHDITASCAQQRLLGLIMVMEEEQQLQAHDGPKKVVWQPKQVVRRRRQHNQTTGRAHVVGKPEGRLDITGPLFLLCKQAELLF
jgi:hypothetical protein